MRVLAFLDGQRADPTAPHLRIDDLGVLRGDGIFETILVVGGQPRELGPHLDRLEQSARMLELPLPERERWEGAVRAVIDGWPFDTEPEMALKLVCTRGVDGGDGTPTGYALGMSVGAETQRKRAHGVQAITLERGFDTALRERAPWLLLSAKTISYAMNMAAMREAERRGVEEVLFTSTDGQVLEGPTANVVLAQGRTLRTPPPSTGILRGTTQGALFRAAEQAGWDTRVEGISPEELHTADGVWVCSSVRLVTRMNSIDGHDVTMDPALHDEITKLYETQYA